MGKDNIIEVRNAKKIYRMGNERIRAVDDVSFEIKKGEFCCLLGASGSGKSTLLNLMAGIEKLTSGDILIKGKNVRTMSEKQLAKFRQNNLGFVFQSYNLLNSMTALENVELPLVFKRVRPRVRQKKAKEMLRLVGLGSRMRHKPKEMSGGQQQRVGIARAFVAKPDIVFADEPTGNLDTKTSFEVMGLIRDVAKQNNQTIVMVTHDPRLTEFADRIISILDGKIQTISVRDPNAQPAGSGTQGEDQSTANGSQSTGNGDQGTDNGDQGTDNGSQTTDNGSQSTANGSQSTGNGDQGTDNGDQSTANGSQTTDNGSQTTGNGSQSTGNGNDGEL